MAQVVGTAGPGGDTDRLRQARSALERGRYREALELIGEAHDASPDEETSYWLSQATYGAAQALSPDPMSAEPGRVADYVELLLLLDRDLVDAIARLPRTPDFDDERATLHHRLTWVRRSVRDQVRYARSRLRWDRAGALDTLDRLFELGRPPAPPLDGRYRGQLVTVTLGPGLDRILNGLARKWQPWLGKRLDAASHTGENLFRVDSRRLLAWRWPQYDGLVEDTDPATGATRGIRGFAFRTWTGRGAVDPVEVLKIDYDLPENPLDVRSVLDELVELSEGYYLGKAHLRRPDRSWRTVAYFSLMR